MVRYPIAGSLLLRGYRGFRESRDRRRRIIQNYPPSRLFGQIHRVHRGGNAVRQLAEFDNRYRFSMHEFSPENQNRRAVFETRIGQIVSNIYADDEKDYPLFLLIVISNVKKVLINPMKINTKKFSQTIRTCICILGMLGVQHPRKPIRCPATGFRRGT